MPRLVVVIPTYNELDNLPKISKALFELNIPDLEILIVDDASPDGTGQLFSHSPSYIAQFLELIKSNDVVVGSRYVSGGRLDERWSWGRWFLSWWANSVWVRLILGVKTKDATAGFKCWRASALRRVGLERIKSNGYVFQVEMCYVAEKIGLRIQEIPIYFEDRRIGRSKMSILVKIEAALRVFDIRKRHREVRPAGEHV
jgi:dolichol-phosphate mannosyltransferase